MGLLHIDRFHTQAIKDHKVICKHVGALIIFRGDVLCNAFREGHGATTAKGQLEDTAEVQRYGSAKLLPSESLVRMRGS
jgi:hypothetical protein